MRVGNPPWHAARTIHSAYDSPPQTGACSPRKEAVRNIQAVIAMVRSRDDARGAIVRPARAYGPKARLK